MTRKEHIDQVLAAFPGFKVNWGPKGAYLRGDIKLRDGAGKIFTFGVEVLVPRRFPAQDAHPQVRLLRHNLPRLPTDKAHIAPNGSMCVQMEPRNEILYERDGLIRFMEHVALHLDRARIWAFTGRYPGPEYPHYEAGRQRYIAELPRLRAAHEAPRARLPRTLRHLANPGGVLPSGTSPCGCGSGQSFAACHQRAIEASRAELADLGGPPEFPRHGHPRLPVGLKAMLRMGRK